MIIKIDSNLIIPPHKVRSQEKLERLRLAFLRGETIPPVLVFPLRNGQRAAFTGSHRVAAAKLAGMELDAIVLNEKEIIAINEELKKFLQGNECVDFSEAAEKGLLCNWWATYEDALRPVPATPFPPPKSPYPLGFSAAPPPFQDTFGKTNQIFTVDRGFFPYRPDYRQVMRPDVFSAINELNDLGLI